MKNQITMPENSPSLIKKHKKAIIITAIVFMLTLCFTLALALSSLILPTNSQVSANLSTPSFKLYFISLNKTQLENSAYSLAADYQKIGAGGYIWKNNGYYHIISSCYEKENDAILVQNNIKLNQNLDSEIFSVDFSSLSLAGDFDADSKKVLAKCLKIFYSTYQSLYDIAISLDTNVYNDISARLAVNSTYTTFNSVYTDFKTLFPSPEIEPLKILTHHLNKGTQILENLCSGKPVTSEQTYSSLIKYRYTQLLATYQDFLSSY